MPRFPEEAPQLAEQIEIDAAVIGHFVNERGPLIGAIRARRPRCFFVFVYLAPTAAGEPAADVSVDVTNGFEPLIRALDKHFAALQVPGS